MPENGELVTCARCRAEVSADAVRCPRCDRLLVGEEWLTHVRAYARMTPEARLRWMKSLTPEQGRRFRGVWQELGAEAEAQAVAERKSKRTFTSIGCLGAILLGLVVVAFLNEITRVEGEGRGLFLLPIVVAALAYLLPLVIAAMRGHHQTGAILVINVFLGWTFIGWVIALAMACSAVRLHSEACSGQG